VVRDKANAAGGFQQRVPPSRGPIGLSGSGCKKFALRCDITAWAYTLDGTADWHSGRGGRELFDRSKNCMVPLRLNFGAVIFVIVERAPEAACGVPREHRGNRENPVSKDASLWIAATT